ncbi:hypothetical protein COOONC_23613, partial [Cooperia oncophora]
LDAGDILVEVWQPGGRVPLNDDHPKLWEGGEEQPKDRNKGDLLKIRAFLELFFCIFWIIWLILGTFWTYSVSKIVTYDKQDGSTYCDHLTYVLAFVIITAIWVIMVMFLVSCCCCCCICCVAALWPNAPPSTSKEKEEKVDE